VITPFYISPSQEDLYEHYVQIARSTALPIIIYSNPARTGGVLPSPDTILRLAQVDNIIALKDSSGNLALTADYITQTRTQDFVLIMGQDKLFYAGLMHGCSGLIAATANVVPDLVAKLYEAHARKDFSRCLDLQERVTLIRQGFESASFPVAAKAMIKMVGIDVGVPKAPLGSGKTLSPVELEKLQELITSATRKNYRDTGRESLCFFSRRLESIQQRIGLGVYRRRYYRHRGGIFCARRRRLGRNSGEYQAHD
jgi:4-hydroxy-tetrahydrodipicolinate synthase